MIASVLVLVGAVTETAALAFLVVSAELVAVTVTLILLVTSGAVNKPALDTVPELADQVTAVLLVPWMVAENCCALPEDTVVLVGEMLTEMLVEVVELAIVIEPRLIDCLP